MDEHKNINIAQCEVVGMCEIDYQIPDDLDTIQKDSIYIQLPDMANKLAKEVTTFDTVEWMYNAENISYIPYCRGVELDLNIRHFLSQQTGI
ncbi:hypothetical protein G9A89_006938 [Geosiphon pyriformis]|nr:hypothetical protein G9A89_006938 [Geosiphon pyriformis]